jgi:triacylglycerol lipase
MVKYPVVLVHGIGFRDGKGNPAHWGRIPAALRAQGAAVYFGHTGAWTDYQTNALILKKNIEKILLETGSEKVNIIAHSKGGIDARCLISCHNADDTVASLTAIATPHHGAEIADLVFGAGIFRARLIRRLADALGRLYGDEAPDISRALEGLTSEHIKYFNQAAARDDRVSYQTIYSAMDKAGDDPLFSFTHAYIRRISGANDGMVSEISARWGNCCRKSPGSLSHHDIIDMKRRPVRGIDPLEIYLDIARGLAERGF